MGDVHHCDLDLCCFDRVVNSVDLGEFDLIHWVAFWFVWVNLGCFCRIAYFANGFALQNENARTHT